MNRWGTVFILLLALFIPCASRAATEVPAYRLKELGIDRHNFFVVRLSNEGKILLGYQKTSSLELKKEGKVFELFALRFSGENLQGGDKILLPLTDMLQIGLSDDGKTALVVGESGTKYLLVDIPSKTVKVLFKHKKGEPGFKCDGLAYYCDGKFYVSGYAYDKDQLKIYHGIAEVHPEESGKAIFSKTLDFDAIVKTIGKPYRHWFFPTGDQGFMTVHPEKSKVASFDLFFYQDGKAEKLDSGTSCGGLAASPNRILYAIKRGEDRREVILKDVRSKKSWTIASGKPYTYLYLNHTDGTVAIVTLLDTKARKMFFFYAREQDDFKLKPVPGLESTRLGALRQSPDGRTFSYFGGGVLKVGRLP